MNSLNQAKVSKRLVTSQRRAAIKLLEKIDKDKCLISNWRPIKIISKIFASRLKKVLPNLISSQQTVCVLQRCINESGRLILVTIDIEKAFDSLDHTFLISAPEKFRFRKTFIDWIKIFFNEQELCVKK